jgi:hypothetical protein
MYSPIFILAFDAFISMCRFLDEERCKHVIRLAEAKLAPSGLALKKGDTLESTREIRTSQGTFMSRQDDPMGVLAYIEDKIAVLTGIPAGHGEAFNILRYELGQHYDSHYDAFAEEEYGKQTSQRVSARCQRFRFVFFFQQIPLPRPAGRNIQNISTYRYGVFQHLRLIFRVHAHREYILCLFKRTRTCLHLCIYLYQTCGWHRRWRRYWST